MSVQRLSRYLIGTSPAHVLQRIVKYDRKVAYAWRKILFLMSICHWKAHSKEKLSPLSLCVWAIPRIPSSNIMVIPKNKHNLIPLLLIAALFAQDYWLLRHTPDQFTNKDVTINSQANASSNGKPIISVNQSTTKTCTKKHKWAMKILLREWKQV